ncbi:hypothetical protein MMA231_02702 [Asticcacaulis sp. MM231]|uniref:hypothetical protein n=1 Tax=Asticcacaulis sp. MM231 TaxID=3157666 RepID=UPI0032D56E00
MELKDFIQGTLIDILSGIRSAQMITKSSPELGIINPVWGGTSKIYEHVQDIKFDIAITASETITGSGQAGIKVVSALDIGGKIQKELLDSRVSRISFTIPIVPAVNTVEDVIKPHA